MKRRIKKQYIYIITIFLLVLLCISIFNIIKWKMDSDNTNKQIDTVQNNVIIEEVKDSDGTEIIVQEEEPQKSNPYWDYIKMDLINVNFNELKNINNDVKGWLQVNGTNINYPIVKTNNNTYYLNHSFDKSYNSAGWVFTDYRNKLNGEDKNIIIYAHGRQDKTMFGSLKNVLNNGWLNNKNNYIFKLSTEKENTLWQVFSVYHIPETSDYLQVDFNDEEEFLDFAQSLLERSNYDFKTTISKNDKIITLSTCYNTTQRVVLHAKMIKRESR